jgi:hypothetical protein
MVKNAAVRNFCERIGDGIYSTLAAMRYVLSRCAAERNSCAREIRQRSKASVASRFNPTKFRSQVFHAQAHISAQSPKPFKNPRLPQPHEDKKRRCGSVAQARQGPQACFRQRGLPRLVLPVFLSFSRAAAN